MFDPAENEVIEKLRSADNQAVSFLDSITQYVELTFSKDTVKIFFEGNHEQCPIPGLQFNGAGDEAEWQFSTYPIGEAFTAFYRLLLTQEESLLSSFGEEAVGSVRSIHSDIRLLSVALNSLDNASKTPSDLMDQLSHFCFSEMGPIYGQRMLKDNPVKILERYSAPEDFRYQDFIDFLGNDLNFTYYCKNLFQVCGAILDYLCRYERHDRYSERSHRISLRRCPRCKRYFTVEDRKFMYCSYKDSSGKTCAQQNEAERKKAFAAEEKSEENHLAEQIRRRLYYYRKNFTNSYDYEKNPIYKKRDALYKLYMECRKKHRASPDYMSWLTECAAHLPKTRNEGYDKFYEWLLERS